MPFTHTHGQWWSIFSTHIPHTLQWCARSGLITIHLSQYLNEPFIVLKLNWNFKIWILLSFWHLTTQNDGNSKNYRQNIPITNGQIFCKYFQNSFLGVWIFCLQQTIHFWTWYSKLLERRKKKKKLLRRKWRNYSVFGIFHAETGF